MVLKLPVRVDQRIERRSRSGLGGHMKISSTRQPNIEYWMSAQLSFTQVCRHIVFILCLALRLLSISWINSITNIQKQGGMHRIEEEGLVAVLLESEVSWCAEQGLLVLVVVEGDEGVRYRYGVMNICKMTVMNHLLQVLISINHPLPQYIPHQHHAYQPYLQEPHRKAGCRWHWCVHLPLQGGVRLSHKNRQWEWRCHSICWGSDGGVCILQQQVKFQVGHCIK